MILVDTSVWIDHLGRGDPAMLALLEEGLVVMHPFVLGEIALASMRQRAAILDALRSIPPARKAEDDEVLTLVERKQLHGTGIGFIDAHLLASSLLTGDTLLWTRDRRLAAVAELLGVDAATA